MSYTPVVLPLPVVAAATVPIVSLGSVPVATGATANYDTGIGVQDLALIGLAIPANGGAVAAGTLTAPIRIDPTGTTTQPVSGTVAVSNLPATQPVSGTVAVSNFPATQPVSAASLPLPTGASTEATLALIKAKTDNLDVALSTRTKPADTQAVSATSLPLPSGAATEATLALIKADVDKIPTSPSQEHTTAVSPSSVRLTDGVAFFKPTTPTDTQPVSAVSLPLPAGASTEATLALIKAKTDNIDVALSTRTKPADTQAVSAASLPLPAGASTEATLALIKAKTDNLDVALSTRTKPADVQKVDGSGVTQPVSGTFWQATQPVSGTFWQATQPVSGTVTANQGTPNTAANAWPHKLTDGTNTAAVKAASTAAVAADPSAVVGLSPNSPLPAGTNALGSVTITNNLTSQAATLCVTATATAGSAVTVTLPAAGAGLFHYISAIYIFATNSTPVNVTSSNVSGSPIFCTVPIASASPASTKDTQIITFPSPLRSAVANTATVFTCPATTGITWRVNVFYRVDV